ncbi:MAG: type VII toxin-antitoxin system HepT family RNase toxin [Candidatus Bathycorpusculaceae bacterium]|uniref:type VII toxin-antitoxin system HepT family RNase toxin n=1 Tax=Candidatus Jordarchaeum sp. TaxID=2823881 RepID=UPI00404B17A9
MFDETGSSVEKILITTKLSKLRQYQRFLKEIQASTIKDFTSDFKISGAAERYLQVAIECIIDIGNEIISSLQLQRPERYRDIPYILAEAKIIPKTFAETISSMIGFRNLLVHDYASINLNLVYEFLQTRLSDFENFTKHIAKWLEKK